MPLYTKTLVAEILVLCRKSTNLLNPLKCCENLAIICAIPPCYIYVTFICLRCIHLILMMYYIKYQLQGHWSSFSVIIYCQYVAFYDILCNPTMYYVKFCHLMTSPLPPLTSQRFQNFLHFWFLLRLLNLFWVLCFKQV